MGTCTSNPSGVYLASGSDNPRQLCTHKSLRHETLTDTGITTIATDLDRMNEQLCDRQLSEILWYLPHVFVFLVVRRGGLCGRASDVIQFRHLARRSEDLHSPKGPRYP